MPCAWAVEDGKNDVDLMWVCGESAVMINPGSFDNLQCGDSFDGIAFVGVLCGINGLSP